MGYVRLFIELKYEDTGASCGQARIELQDRPGHMDGKVRCALRSLPEGASYEAALVCEAGGQYREYPLGAFMVGTRGQAMPMFRLSAPAGQPEGLGLGEFKAFVARGKDGLSRRIVGYRSERIAIPDAARETEAEAVPRPEAKQEAQPEQPSREKSLQEEADEKTEAAEGISATATAPAEQERGQDATPKEEPAASFVPAEPETDPQVSEEPAKEPAMTVSKPQTNRQMQLVYVMRDLEQVDAVCGDAGKRAFQRYHHLIVMQQGEESFLGMPCRYRPSQELEIGQEGYREFVTPHGGAPSYGEFGYWLKKLS